MHQLTKITMMICKMVWNYNGRYSKPVPFNRKFALLLAVLTLLSLTFIVLPAPGLAHPPATVDLDYSLETQTLSIAITHQVSDPDNHYVEKIEVTENGFPLLTEEYTSQPSPSTFTYTYTIAAREGDVLDVTAYCNLFGNMKKQITISLPSPSVTPTPAPVHAPTPTAETPGFELLAALMIGIGIGLYRIKRRDKAR